MSDHHTRERDFKPAARRRARRFVLQGLYEHVLTGHSAVDIEARCRTTNDLRRTDVDYMHELFSGVVRERAVLEADVQPLLDRPWSQLTPVEHAALLIGSYELHFRLDIPREVVLSEAVDLTVHFGTSDGHRYVNAVLDRLARTLRPHEGRDG